MKSAAAKPKVEAQETLAAALGAKHYFLGLAKRIAGLEETFQLPFADQVRREVFFHFQSVSAFDPVLQVLKHSMPRRRKIEVQGIDAQRLQFGLQPFRLGGEPLPVEPEQLDV